MGLKITGTDIVNTSTTNDILFKDNLGATKLKVGRDGSLKDATDVKVTIEWAQLTGIPSTFAPSAHTHTIANITSLQAALDAKAALASPSFTGTPIAPTAAAGTNTTQLATTSFVTSAVSTAVSGIVDSSPAALDTLKELATALGNDANFSTTISTALGNRLRVDINNQGLTVTQQGNARTNLGLGTAATANTGDFAAASHTHTAATTSVAGFMSAADKTKLDGIASGATAASGTVTSVSGTGSVSGLTLSGTVTSSGSLTLGGTLALTSANVTTALGFTPYNATNPSGYITSSSNITGTSAGVVRTVSGTTSAELVRGNMGDNDQARILVGATASNAGFLEISTADDASEPIHVRQYTGVFTTLVRTATLLDGSGNTSFPGTVSAPTFSGALSGNATTATTLQTTRSINGTNFNGSADITTVNWGTARTITIGATGKSVNGAANASWTLAEIGAQVAGDYMTTRQTRSDIDSINNGGNRYDPSVSNPTNEHYAVLTYGNGGNVTGQLATHFQTGDLFSRGYNSSWSAWRRYWNDRDFTSTNISNWNTAFGWGNHAGLYVGLTGNQSVAGDKNFTGKLISTGTGELFALESGGSPYIRFNIGGTGTTGTYLMKTWGSSRVLSIETMGDSQIVIDENNNMTDKAFIVRHNGTAGPQLFRVQEDGNAYSYGNLLVTGNVTGSNLNVSNWNTAFDWGNHAGLYAPLARTITAGDGLTGGGDLTTNRTISVDSTVVRTSGDQTIGGNKTFTGAQIDIQNTTRWLVSSSNSSNQRVDARTEATSFARLHWYGMTTSAGTSNFRHAWYDGSNYINVTANAGGRIDFDGAAVSMYIGLDRVYDDGYHPVADTWTTARTVTIGNTGKSVNGSANVAWTLAEIGAAATSHNHDDRYFTETESDGRYWRTVRSVSVTTTTDGNNSNPFDDAHIETKIAETGNYQITYTGASAHMITSTVGGSASVFQIGAHYDGSNYYMRTRTDSTSWQTWKRIWHSGDFSSTNVSNWNAAFAWGNHALQSYATTGYVDTAVAELVDTAPDSLNTLRELAAALGEDPNFATTITNSIATKAPLASPALTGTPTAPTAATATNTTQIATTAFVKAQGYSTTTGTVTSVSGTGGYGGLTLTGTVTSSGSLTLGGTPTGTWPISISGNAATATTANRLTVTANDTFSGTYPILWHDGTTVYSSSWMTVRGSDDRLFVPNITASGNVTAATFTGALSGNATTATTATTTTGNAGSATVLQTARTINGTSFNGSADITTTTWGAARTITIGSTGKSVNGGANVSWTLAEIGAYAATNPSGYATTGYVDSAVANLIDTAPDALNTLNELAAALGDDPNFATTVTNNIAGKVSKTGDTLSGALTMAGTQKIIHAGFAGIEYYNSSSQWQGYIGTENNTGNLRYNSFNGNHTWYANGVQEMQLDASGNLNVAGTVTALGTLTVSKSGTNSTISFPAQTNDPGFIQHYELNNTSRMYFSVSDDNSTTDYFGFGYAADQTRFIIYSNGAIYGKSTAEFDGRVYADDGLHVRGDWVRVNGVNGLYFESYGGGWNMTDSTFIRVYGTAKTVYNPGAGFRTGNCTMEYNSSTKSLDFNFV
jgi:hypothetical protein